MIKIQCVVIGAGVVGLAVAAALSNRGLEVIVLEKEGSIGLHASSHNSGVIPAMSDEKCSSHMLNLLAMDSPALTSSLAIADHVAGKLLPA